ncbi:ESPR-type extended signal peptide-containing protein, partial [Ignatzschineria cameli]
MNRIYRVVWCHVRNIYVVASELASRKKVKSSKTVNVKKRILLGAAFVTSATIGSFSHAEDVFILNENKKEISLNQSIFEQDQEEVAFILGINAKAEKIISKDGLKDNIDAIILGNDAVVKDERSIAIGNKTESTLDSIVLGYGAEASSFLKDPQGPTDKSYGMIAIGSYSFAEGKTATALGFRSKAVGTSSSAIGGGAVAVGEYSTAIGGTSLAKGNNTVAIGVDSITDGDSSVAIGMGAKASGSSSTAFGTNAESQGYASVAVGTDSIAVDHYTVSFGHDYIPARKDEYGDEIAEKKELNRRLVHVDKGLITETSTDAINGSQLYLTNKLTVDALGGGAQLDEKGTIKLPNYKFKDESQHNNVGDALTNLDTRINEGLTFAGNAGFVNKKLGETLTIKGGLADGAEATAENLRVDVNEKNELVIKMSKDLKGLENIVVGSDGKDGKAGVSINGKDGSIGLTGPAGKDGKPGASTTITVIKDGKPGVDGKDGETEVRVVYKDKNGDQQQIANLNDGLKFAGDNPNVKGGVKLNEVVNLKGGAEGDLTDNNIGVVADIDEKGMLKSL